MNGGMRIVSFGEGALLAELGDTVDEETTRRVLALRAVLERERLERTGLGATVPGYASLLVPFDEDVIDAAGVEALLSQVLFTGQGAADAGVVDDLLYEEELAAHVTKTPADKAAMQRADRYLAWHESRLFRPLRRKPYIAVIPVQGAITVDPRRRPAGTPGADLQQLTRAIRTATEDKRALGVVLHVNSPGGSALASDLIHREVEACRRHKPVVALFGEVAASGGYYVAACADAIVAQPMTITGSIGVLMAKAVIEPLLARVGIVTETILMSPNADLFSVSRPLTADQRAILEREADRFYETFVGVVAAGRSKPAEVVEPLARGRVWSGAAAIEHGLVDKTGGMAAALDEVRERARGVSKKAAALLEPRVIAAGAGPIPPPVPPPAQASLALIAEAAPELSDLFALSLGNDRVLYYAAGLPKIA